MRERTHLRWGGGRSNATGVKDVHALEEKPYLTSPVLVQNALVSYQGRKLLREPVVPGGVDRVEREGA